MALEHSDSSQYRDSSDSAWVTPQRHGRHIASCTYARTMHLYKASCTYTRKQAHASGATHTQKAVCTHPSSRAQGITHTQGAVWRSHHVLLLSVEAASTSATAIRRINRASLQTQRGHLQWASKMRGSVRDESVSAASVCFVCISLSSISASVFVCEFG